MTNDRQLGCLCPAAGSELVCIPTCLFAFTERLVFLFTLFKTQGLTLHFSSQVVKFFSLWNSLPQSIQSPVTCFGASKFLLYALLDSCSVPLHL